MAATKEMTGQYIKGLMEAFTSKPDSLNQAERVLLANYKKAEESLRETLEGCESLKSQLQQGQARLRSLELSLENQQGVCDGIVSSLVALKFTEEVPLLKEGAGRENPNPILARSGSKANGSSKHKGDVQ